MAVLSKIIGFSIVFAALSLTASGAAFADAGHGLEAQDVRVVTQACERDQPFFPIIGDLGKATGEYALPVRDEAGEVVAAIILTHAAIRSIPECRKSEARVAQAKTGGGVQLAAINS